jgi:hypothetical protein
MIGNRLHQVSHQPGSLARGDFLFQSLKVNRFSAGNVQSTLKAFLPFDMAIPQPGDHTADLRHNFS